MKPTLEESVERLRCNDPDLRELSLLGHRIGDHGAKELAYALRTNCNVVDLDLGGNKIGAGGAKVLADVLRCNRAIEKLSLGVDAFHTGNLIGDEGAAALAEVLKENGTLRELHLDCNGITDRGAEALAEALRHNHVLKKLDLGAGIFSTGNNVTAAGAKVLLEALRHNSALTDLGLWGNKISDDGLKAAAATLVSNSVLRILDVGDSGIGDEGAQALAIALRTSNTLAELNLGKNQIGDKGAQTMAGALRDNRSLVVLNLEGNLIGSPGATALARVLRHDGALVELYLEGNFIGDEGATLLVEALTQNPALKELGLDCNNVSEDVMRELEERVAALHGGPSDLQKDGPSRINKILFSELQMQQEPDLRISNYITVQQATWHGQKVAAVTIQRNEADSYPVALERLGQHPRIAKLHGISEVHEERRVLVTEFSPEGSLDEVLQNLKGQARTISIMVVLQCAIQVCEGMLHVVTDDFVCFDLALRNVLVFGFDPKNHNALRLKLAYYGLICGHLGKNGSKENASICLIAPETRRWSEKSAVWAFGMLLWQLWSARELLYMPGSEIEVAQILLRGECLEKPKKCPDSVFSVMEWCWKKQPSERQSFQELKSELLHVIATFEAAKVEEIPYQDLHMGKALGIGSGKTVRQATWRGQNVAVLTLHTKEASIELTAFERLGRHPRLIQLIGISWDSEGNCLLVTELAPLGSLDKVLGDLEEEGSAASNLVLVKCAMQVCEGMEQIAEEGLVHRRLGLRNVMVFGFNPVIQNAVYLKISDYGLSRDDLCFYDGWEDMPIRWMAPESVKKRQWSEKSDVWAFGVLMWELWSMAEIPYALNSNKEVAQLVSRGEHPAKPPTCPDRIYALMKQCWEIQTAQRPTFQELRVELLDLYSAMASSSSNLHIT